MSDSTGIRLATIVMTRVAPLLVMSCVVVASPVRGHQSSEWHTVSFKQDGAASQRVEVQLVSRSRDAIRIKYRMTTIFSNGKQLKFSDPKDNEPSKISVDCTNKTWLYDSTGVAWTKTGAFWKSRDIFRNDTSLTRDFDYVCSHFN